MRKLSPPRFKRLWIIIAILMVLIIGAGLAGRAWYNRNLAAVSDSTQITEFAVEPGASLHQIAVGLKDYNLIRNSVAFERYVRSRGAFPNIKAGIYALRPSMSTPQIVDRMVKGRVSTTDVTIYPGKTLDDIRTTFKRVGYGDAELNVAFNPSTYPDEPILANLPSGASLEGLLYPDTFQKDAGTSAQAIIRQSLEEMRARLTPDIVAGFKAHGLNTYQGVTLASIVYQESGDAAAEPTIAQVFYKRMAQGMPLQSNVTANYAADKAGVARTVTINSPYNTYLHTGLPPGPISNMTDSALKAVANPASSDYLFFVVGEDCVIHFTHTQAEHDAAIQNYGLGCKQKQ